MSNPIFTGSGVALVTPMNADGSVNFKVLGELLDFHMENKTDAIVVCGTTGESACLSHKEHCEVIEYTVKRVDHKIPVIAGTGSNDTNYAIELSKEAKTMGVDAILSVTPYYNKTSQAGLIKHFTAIADAVDIPMILYNVPARTGLNILPATYAELSKHPNIVATKEANGNISSVAETRSLCDDDFAIYSGNDDQIIPIMALGGIGVISVYANFCPRNCHNITTLALHGNYKEATAQFLHSLELINSMSLDVNPIPVKTAMNLLGYECGPLRLPLTELSESNLAKLTDCLKKYQLM
ncbi:MAG: 4-hydroxy-tetrahydrodipicolinate synthase [Bacillota bacterium]|nr:4-hydroxy-tetrahydrodipicolinate synthase [Bacillota bacterium]